MDVFTWLGNYVEILLLFLILIVTWIIHHIQSQRGLPPGPWGIPILGFLPFMRKEPHKIITRLGKKYGNVMSLYMGNLLVFILNDYDAIKEAFVKQGSNFSAKPERQAFKNDPHIKALGLSEGEVASQHRRFILSTFRDFGMGKTSLEPQIMDEVKYFLREVKKSNGQPIDLKPLLGLSVSNVIAVLQFGNRYDYEDEQFIRLRKMLAKSSKFVGSTAIKVFLPWLKYLPFTEKLTGQKHMAKSLSDLKEFYGEKIAKNIREHVPGSKAYYIDSYITHMQDLMEKNGSTGYFDENFLTGNLLALFAAGSETITTTLLWALQYLIKYPSVLQKVRKEIDDVIGSERDPTLSDKFKMPYTEATMLEIHRFASVLPFSIVHSNFQNANIFGYQIPKRSYVLANLWAVHHSEDLWKDPENFRPERFLDKDGKVCKPEYLIPFSIGKRNCIGESLAEMELFLYFISILQTFDLDLPEGENLTLEATMGITLIPKQFKLCMKIRNDKL